ncbi:MAG: VOC family protein [Atopobiaceae bacterium]
MLEAQELDVMVYADDVEACRRYWTQKLGFVEVGTRPGPDDSMAYELSFGVSGAHVVLMDRALVQKFSPEVSTAMPSLLFRVVDFDACHEQMQRNGATVSPVVDMGGMRTFSFSDEEGHWMAVAEG